MAKDKKEEETTNKSGGVSGKLEQIIKSIEELTVIELADLVKALQEKFGVTSAPLMAQGQGVAAAAAPAASQPEEAKDEGQTTFNLILVNSGANKISVIKALREIDPQLGLKEAKDIADNPPKEILTGVNKEQVEEAKKKLETAGASVEVK